MEPNPERLAELETLRDGGAYAVHLEERTIWVSIPEGYSVCIQGPVDKRRLRMLPVVPGGQGKAAALIVSTVPEDQPVDGEYPHSIPLTLQQQHPKISLDGDLSGPLAPYKPAHERALDAIRDLMSEALLLREPGGFALISELGGLARSLQALTATRVADVDPRPRGGPVFMGAGPVADFMGGAPRVGDNDFANLMRELMMHVSKQAANADRKTDHAEARWERSQMMSDIEQIRTMQNNGTSTPELDRRLALLLKQLETINNADEDRIGPTVVSPDVSRGHPPDGAGREDPGGVGESD